MTDSLREEVQARRAQLQADTSVTLDVPGYEGILRARYRALSLKEINRIAANVAKVKGLDADTRELYTYADSLALASEAVYSAKLDKGRKEDDPPPQGKKWSPGLASDLGFEAANPRQAVFAVFARDTQIWSHYQTLLAWMDGENDRIDEELAGESEPPQPSS
jgi:hypothetical protein